MEEVILVNMNDEVLGSMEKMQAHKEGVLHRAFSIFIFNTRGEMLIHQRAMQKYHSGGLWTNACCSHPRPGESTEAAASRRLYEELSISTDLKELFAFTYQTPFDNGLMEHEYDHIFSGIYEGVVSPDPNEISDYCYISLEDLSESLRINPSKYTSWFRIAFPKIQELMEKNNAHAFERQA